MISSIKVFSGKHLAKEYNVAESTITRIKQGRESIVINHGSRNYCIGSASESFNLERKMNIEPIEGMLKDGLGLSQYTEKSITSSLMSDFKLTSPSAASETSDKYDIKRSTPISNNSSQSNHDDDVYNKNYSGGMESVDYNDDSDTVESDSASNTANANSGDIFDDVSSDSFEFNELEDDPNELCEKLQRALCSNHQNELVHKIISKLRHGGYIE